MDSFVHAAEHSLLYWFPGPALSWSSCYLNACSFPGSFPGSSPLLWPLSVQHPRGQRSQAFLSAVPSKVTSSSLMASTHMRTKPILEFWARTSPDLSNLHHRQRIWHVTGHLSTKYLSPYCHPHHTCSLVPVPWFLSHSPHPSSPSANLASCNFKIHPESNYSSPSSLLLPTYHAPATISSLPMIVAIDSHQCMIPPPPRAEWFLCSRQNGPFKCKSFHVTFLLKAFYWLPTHSE